MTKNPYLILVAVIGVACAIYGLLYDRSWWLPVTILTLVTIISAARSPKTPDIR